MKESEIKVLRKQALDYSQVLKRVTDPKYFPTVMKAMETKDANLLDSVFAELELPTKVRDHLKQVMFTEPMFAAPVWG